MPIDLSQLIPAETSALVLQEIQEGVVGRHSALPELAKVAQEQVIPNAERLAQAARSAGIRVIHCKAELREDFWGLGTNARLFNYMRKAPVKLWQGSDAAEVAAGLSVEPEDLVLTRCQGLSPFTGSELDLVLRNAGVTALVVAGVSLNVAVQCLTYEAVNHSYQVVLPRDAVAGTPKEYADQVLAHSLSTVATVTSTEEVVASWGSSG